MVVKRADPLTYKERRDREEREVLPSVFKDKAQTILDKIGTSTVNKGVASADREVEQLYQDGDLVIRSKSWVSGGWYRVVRHHKDNAYPHSRFRQTSSVSSLKIEYKGETVFTKVFSRIGMEPSENPQDPSAWEYKVNELYEQVKGCEVVPVDDAA